MLDDDYGGVAGPDDEPTMPNGAQGSGRRPGALRRDGWAPRPPESTFRHHDPTILTSRRPREERGRSWSFRDKAVEWERVPDAIASMTQNILGGSWSSACSPYTHNCAQTPELYVVMIESRIIWLQRNTTGGVARINEEVVVEMVWWEDLVLVTPKLCSSNLCCQERRKQLWSSNGKGCPTVSATAWWLLIVQIMLPIVWFVVDGPTTILMCEKKDNPCSCFKLWFISETLISLVTWIQSFGRCKCQISMFFPHCGFCCYSLRMVRSVVQHQSCYCTVTLPTECGQ